MAPDGGYDEGYRASPCFWGMEPGSLFGRLADREVNFSGMHVLDAGCGEGKNAIYLARRGARVEAWDVSELALEHARSAWADAEIVQWVCGDVRHAKLKDSSLDLIVMYGLLHCLPNEIEVQRFVEKTQAACKPGGFQVIVAFNDRRQELDAHPGFDPTLLSHGEYITLYDGWRIHYQLDSDLHETHPHNLIPHVHSLTRLIVEKC